MIVSHALALLEAAVIADRLRGGSTATTAEGQFGSAERRFREALLFPPVPGERRPRLYGGRVAAAPAVLYHPCVELHAHASRFLEGVPDRDEP